ncbi:membrane protein insertase YidC [Marinovum sp. 2_MG-2023]|uniref:membrane protein insertase YidC n=1 Tax=Roseobacteraceae TaxID=2854170 RepID=UPI001FD3F292|nr:MULTISPECIES: membrane protein insertase YidC [Roseobacteraceae]MCJ7871669.1 membrane protein insertase YidC [Phaeobacter sp. J2-8]MDO6728509.1 membrane protein insertase YidC [Marinovum sp. 2_MG-2023]MDO6778075.1 membrane protein insertase YidC [Marinovum sp. 1_MG-2023]
MDDQNKNLILATGLSFIVILIWFVLFPPPEAEVTEPATVQTEIDGGAGAPSVDGVAETPSAAPGTTPVTEDTTADTATDAPRIMIETARLSGSISALGGRIDTLALKDYRETLDEGAPIVSLLKPVGQPGAYYALYGWAPGQGLNSGDVPGPNTEWQVDTGRTLSEDTPVTLTWDNGKGLMFTREIAVDQDYMFTITQKVANSGSGTVSMAPYGILARHGEPADLKNFFVLHEGVVGMADGELSEISYDDMTDFDVLPSEGAQAEVMQVSENGWIGFADHYWMTTLAPAPGSAFKAAAKYDARRDIYQTETVLPTQTLASGAEISATTQLFAGAKEWETIREYQADGVQGFIDSIDWGWFFFLTKPIFAVLHWLNGVIGNMGWAIIGLTFLIKALLFPLAYKSYASMAKMRELQPEMQKIKERAGDDRQKLQQETMALYKKEKVNPAAGCLPILLQIPIFFSLYKVIFVTLELRHAPFIGWIKDLSAPDPSSLYNLWGLLPWGNPEPGSILALVFIGILPLLLGISMWLQQKLNPAPTDPTQQMIFAWMPWVFMFMLGSFASGLVVYWIANNTITFSQQYLIMRSHGYKPDLFENIKSTFRRSKSGKKAEEKTGK